jgi:glucose-6-phosphate isomerase
VEAGKKAAASVLNLQRQLLAVLKLASEPMPLTALAEKAGAADQLETVYKILRHLAANHRGITLQGDRAKPSRLLVSLDQ